MDEHISYTHENERRWAEVILPLAVPVVYTYSIPEQFWKNIYPGIRVEVIFGKNKRYAGLIKRIVKRPEFETKDIVGVIDTEPVVYPQQLNLWEWMSRYYMCSEGEVMIAALPAHLKLSSESVVQFNEDYGNDFSDLDNNEYLLAEALLLKKELRISEVRDISDQVNVYPVLKRLVEKGVCDIYETLNDDYATKKETYISLNPEFDNDDSMRDLMEKLGRAPRQLELLLSYLHFRKTEGEVRQPQLLQKSGASYAHLKGLLQKGILFSEKRSVDRLPLLPKENMLDFELSTAQAKAYDDIENKLLTNNICLLHGATGSGKTMLYIRLISEIIARDKQALYLLPEISLTTQIIRKLRKCFGGNIAIYHSKFNNKERMEIWNKVKNKEVRVVIGARSALFLPFSNLGLVIIDEEQDSSYKQQDPAPRYNARDTAIYYAGIFRAKVILGTATPSLESYHNALKGKFGLVSLPDRYGRAGLPEIEIIDLKTIGTRGGEKVILSPQLKQEMEAALKKRQQIILFQNRRGYSPMLVCGMCGYIPKCMNCDVSLTWHKTTNKLQCHYCGSVYSILVKCPACGSSDWRERNFGTEKIEEVLMENFPEARVARMDVDALRGKYAHESLIKSFEQQRIDILAGTQMVVKGLDFENVMLVGILNADALLNFTDFRVHERAFQLMEQVSGRAGRRKGTGKVLIQAAKTDHPVLMWVKDHDFRRFYENEIQVRKQFFYPPFSRIIKIRLKHKKKVIVQAAALEFGKMLEKYFKHITGPAEPVIGRIRNKYLMDVMLKLLPDRKRLEVQKETIKNCISLLRSKKEFRSVVVVSDADPI